MTENEVVARIVELESRQAFLDDTIISQNQALVQQQQRITQLEKMLALMLERFRAPDLDLDLPAAEPPPPHY